MGQLRRHSGWRSQMPTDMSMSGGKCQNGWEGGETEAEVRRVPWVAPRSAARPGQP